MDSRLKLAATLLRKGAIQHKRDSQILSICHVCYLESNRVSVFEGNVFGVFESYEICEQCKIKADNTPIFNSFSVDDICGLIMDRIKNT